MDRLVDGRTAWQIVGCIIRRNPARLTSRQLDVVPHLALIVDSSAMKHKPNSVRLGCDDRRVGGRACVQVAKLLLPGHIYEPFLQISPPQAARGAYGSSPCRSRSSGGQRWEAVRIGTAVIRQQQRGAQNEQKKEQPNPENPFLVQVHVASVCFSLRERGNSRCTNVIVTGRKLLSRFHPERCISQLVSLLL